MAFDKALCPILQEDLLNLSESAAPISMRDQCGFFDALTSDYNTAGTNITPVDQKNGRKRQVEVWTVARANDIDDTDTDFTDYCNDNGDEVPPISTTYSITRSMYTKPFYLDMAELRKICVSDKNHYLSLMFLSRLNALQVAINKDLLGVMALNFGEFWDTASNAAKPVDILTSGTGINNLAAYPQGMGYVLEDFADMEVTDRPILVGAGRLAQFARLSKWGCCNSQIGVDMTQIMGDAYFFRDKYVEGVLGANQFFGFAPKTLQLATYNENAGDFAMMAKNVFEFDTLYDPYSGLTYDFFMKFDDCKRRWVFMLGLQYELISLVPATDGFGASDPMSGSNLSLRYEATLAA